MDQSGSHRSTTIPPLTLLRPLFLTISGSNMLVPSPRESPSQAQERGERYGGPIQRSQRRKKLRLRQRQTPCDNQEEFRIRLLQPWGAIIISRCLSPPAAVSQAPAFRSTDDSIFTVPRSTPKMIAVLLLPAAVLGFQLHAGNKFPTTTRCRSTSPVATSFSDRRALEKRIQSLQSIGIGGLSGFYDAGVRTFALSPDRPRFSVTTTVFSLLAIDAAPKEWSASGEATQRVKGCLEGLLDADGREDDVMRATLCLCALRKLDPQSRLLSGDNAAPRWSRVSASFRSMTAARPQRRAGRHQPLSAYLRFWMAYASSLLLNPTGESKPFLSPMLPSEALPTGSERAVELTLERSCDAAYDDVCRQLAFKS